MAGTARDEAERLVAAVLAMAGSAAADNGATDVGERVAAGVNALSDKVSDFLGRLSADPRSSDTAPNSPPGSTTARSAATGGGATSGGATSGGAGGHWATGSAECCVCPVCRVISTMRDPGPETAVRLAMGAGDLATGVASVMRAFSSMVGERPSPAPARPRRPENRDENWSAATRATNRPDAAWSAATNPGPAHRADTAGSTPAGHADATPTTATKAGPAHRADTAGFAGHAEAAPTPGTAGAEATDPWSAATSVSAAEAEAAHAAEAAARAARLEAERAAQREAARAASQRAKEAAERVAEAVRLAEAARDPGGAEAGRTGRKRDVWAAATADGGVAAAGGGETLDHDGSGATEPDERGGATGDDARGGGAV